MFQLCMCGAAVKGQQANKASECARDRHRVPPTCALARTRVPRNKRRGGGAQKKFGRLSGWAGLQRSQTQLRTCVIAPVRHHRVHHAHAEFVRVHIKFNKA